MKEKYVIKDSGEICTAEGKVETVEECKYLAKDVESIYPNINKDVKEETNVDYPSGCYVYTEIGHGFGIYFNHAKDGLSNLHSRPFCGKLSMICPAIKHLDINTVTAYHPIITFKFLHFRHIQD